MFSCGMGYVFFSVEGGECMVVVFDKYEVWGNV